MLKKVLYIIGFIICLTIGTVVQQHMGMDPLGITVHTVEVSDSDKIEMVAATNAAMQEVRLEGIKSQSCSWDKPTNSLVFTYVLYGDYRHYKYRDIVAQSILYKVSIMAVTKCFKELLEFDTLTYSYFGEHGSIVAHVVIPTPATCNE